MFMYGFITQIIKGIPWGTNPMPDGALMVTTLFVVLLWTGIYLLFRFSKLSTLISENGIEVKFPPFFRNPKVFTHEMIKHWKVRKYNPFMEFGGWGVRYGMNGRAYNVKGRMGLELEFMNGKKLLIGTQKKEQIRWAMEKFLESKSM